MAMAMAGGMSEQEVEDAIDQIDEGIIAIDKALLVDLPEPVSYTHLDVYKRQSRNRQDHAGQSSGWRS